MHAPHRPRRRLLPRSLLLLPLALAAACTGAQPRVLGARDRAAAATDAAARADADFAERIADEPAWRALAAAPQRELTARTEIVKLVIDLEDANRVYFLQSRRWEIHYYFIQRFLGRPGHPIPDSEAFWRREYLSPDRRFIQAAIVRYRDQNVWALELVAQDVLDVPRALEAFRRVRERVYFGPQLRYHPVPAHHVAATAQIRAAGVPVVTNDEIFASTRFQPLNVGEAFGYLRFFDTPTVEPSRVRPYDIVVLAQVPLDLPVCAGVITAELQTPLSHIAVLSANRGTPNMALRDAHRDARLRALEGRLVRLHVTPQDFTVEPASQADAERAWRARQPREPFHPPRAARDPGLPALADIRMADLPVVGAKAAQLGELAHIAPPVRLPRAFAVPFAAYERHLHAAGLDAELARMLADPAFASDAAARERMLAAFRERIRAAPVDRALIAALRARITAVMPGAARVRLRSSTNAEDLPGFNGAGLYESAVWGPLAPSGGQSPRSPAPFAGATDAQLADGLRRVWASTWSFQGFEERAYYRIEQREVAMAVLVQESIDDDQAIGVAITANPFDQGRPGYFINAQLSAGSVTSAAAGEVPEQVLFYTYPPPGAHERISSSSRTGGRPVLSDAEVTALARVLMQIHQHFCGTEDWQSGHAMDVEYLIAGPDRHVVIVQARPYTMRWDEGRGYAQPPQ